MSHLNRNTGMERRTFMGLAASAVAAPLVAGRAPLPRHRPDRGSAPSVPTAEPSGDRIVYPADAFAGSPGDPGVLDVKTLFGAAGDGVTDDTQALIAAIDAVEGAVRDDWSDWSNAWKVIYLPNGTYLVSDTLVYSFPFLSNPNHKSSEGLRYLRLRGESQDGVVIRLIDHAPGFDSASTPVISFAKGTSNITVASNAVENLTIDVGSGNPGATGLLFAGANNAVIRNVTIRSSDPSNAGQIGLHAPVSTTQFYAYNVDIHGFDHAVSARPSQATQLTFERLTIRDFQVSGIRVTGSCVSLRHLTSETTSSAPALSLEDGLSQVSLVESAVSSTGHNAIAAISVSAGSLYAHDVAVDGYQASIQRSGSSVATGDITRYTSYPVETLIPGTLEIPTTLSVEPTPDIPWPTDLTAWRSVNSFGAVGDGSTDDTAAIQAAMDSGAPVVYFRPGNYLVTSTVDIPPTVQRVNFMYSRISIGSPLIQPIGTPIDDEYAVYKVGGSANDTPLIIEDMMSSPAEGVYRMFEHASQRPLVLSDLHLQRGGLYKNSAAGSKVYLKNASNRSAKAADGNPPFVFRDGAQAWARHINPEYGAAEIVNTGSAVWILGFKKENDGQLLLATGGGQTEVINGVVYESGSSSAHSEPLEQSLVVCEDSSASISLATSYLSHPKRYWQTYITETQASLSGELEADALPVRGNDIGSGSQRHLALYVGRVSRRPPRGRQLTAASGAHS